MFKTKKILSVIMLALMIFSFSALPAFSQARHGVQVYGGVEANSDLVLPAGTWVYGWKIYADTAASWATLYNAATYRIGQLDKTLWVDEIGEATQYEDTVIWFERPIYCGSGVSVEMGHGTVYIYYGEAPSTR